MMAMFPPEGTATYSHGLKLEETAKGLRIHTHVYTMDKDTAIEQAFDLYLDARARALESHIILAPMENNGK